jgi:hypothetical protein
MAHIKHAIIGRFGYAVYRGSRQPNKPKPISLHQPRNIDPQIQAPPREPRPDGRRIGYGPPDKDSKVAAGSLHFKQAGPIDGALCAVRVQRILSEDKPGAVLKRALSIIRPGDTLVIYDAIHASGCSVSALRKLSAKVEERSGKLMILRVGSSLFLDWDDCEKRIHRACVERAKANKRYKAGDGRPRKLKLEDARKLKVSGLTPEQIAEKRGVNRATVFRALRKIAATKAA